VIAAKLAGLRGLLIIVFFAGVLSCSRDAGELQPSISGAPAQRVIALAPHLTELLFTAGAGDRLVGVVEFSDYPDAARALPRVGDAFRLDYEAIAALEPDLILGWASGNPKNVFKRLRELDYRVVALEPGSLDSVADQLRLIGRLTGTSVNADRAATEYEQALAGLRDRYRDAEKISVFYQVSAQPMLTISRRQLIGQAIETCAGRNIFADLNELTPAVSIEAVIDRAPDVIILAGFGTNETQVRESLSLWARWTNIPAVRHGDMYVVNADLIARPSVRMLGGVGQICEQLDAARRKESARTGL
jgi:iron complex transport system substrate-binding protein